MAKRSVTARLEEEELRRAARYLKTRGPAATVRAAVGFHRTGVQPSAEAVVEFVSALVEQYRRQAS